MSASDVDTGLIITDKGITIPDVATIRQGRANDLRAIWGQDLDVSPATPQGQIIDTDTVIIDNKNAQLQFALNQIDPEKAEGVWQDGICKIAFITRKPAQPTRVICQVIGSVGTVIPAGSMVQDKNKNLYASQEDFTITSSSPMDLEFVCTVAGPIECPAGSIDRIFTQIPSSGWDSVFNREAGVTGNYAESRKTLENRRYRDVAKNAHGNVDSVRGSIGNLDGVLSVAVEDNTSNKPMEINGVTIDGHSLFISVYGGDNQEIAYAIEERIDGGAGMDGNHEEIIQTPTRLSTKPTRIRFNRPHVIQCQVRVTIELYNYTLTTDISDQIKQRVVDAWNGNDNESIRVQIGEEIFASRFYCPVREISQDGIFFDIINIKIRRQITSGGEIVIDNAFTLENGRLIPNKIPEGETNPFFENTVEEMLATKDGVTPVTEGSVFTLENDKYLVNRTDMLDTSSNSTWGEWADSVQITLDEFPALSIENVLIETEVQA